jgi:surface polysaccharide O-acyltransferase-like enzyme
MGYFIFSHDSVQHIVQRVWRPLMVCAVVAGVTLVVTTFGQDNTLPQYLGTPLNNLYGYLMCLAMMGWFKACFDRTGRFAGYMTRSSYGIYIVHYLIIVSLGYLMKTHTQMPTVCMYLILTVAVFTLSPLLYEILRRIPFIRWCVLGESRRSR